MAELLLKDVIVHRTHSSTTRQMVMDAFGCVLGDGGIEEIHMFPRNDRRTGESYWKIAIEFSKRDYRGHRAEVKVRQFNEQLESTGEVRVYFADVSPNGNRYFLKCVVDQKIVRRNGQRIPDLFRGRSAAEENITIEQQVERIQNATERMAERKESIKNQDKKLEGLRKKVNRIQMEVIAAEWYFIMDQYRSEREFHREFPSTTLPTAEDVDNNIDNKMQFICVLRKFFQSWENIKKIVESTWITYEHYGCEPGSFPPFTSVPPAAVMEAVQHCD